jgi:hypothetical protein
MTWNTVTVAAEGLDALLGTIRSTGGTVTNCRPGPAGVMVTWTTPG